MSPNVPDENTYTPMYDSRGHVIWFLAKTDHISIDRHAAASYAQVEVLEYLVSQGHCLAHSGLQHP